MMPSKTKVFPVAMIGCGAMAETFYLPALVHSPHVAREAILVDQNPERLRLLQSKFKISRSKPDYRLALQEAEAVIIAVPPSAQYSIARDALKAGLHVLCEKPLAPSAAEARDLIAQARQAGRVLAVNNTRRLFPTSREIKRLLEAGALGDLRSISYFEGQPFEWPTASGFYFQAGVSPRGVLLDRGAHVLDLICWWLNAQPKVTRSHHDSFGGPEAVAHLELEHLDCRIDVRLSWLSQQANRFSIEGEKGRISGNIYDFQTFQLELADGRRQVRMPSRANVFADFGRLLIESFVAAIRGEAHQLVYGADVVDSIEVLDRCYEEGSRFALPWYDNLRTDASE